MSFLGGVVDYWKEADAYAVKERELLENRLASFVEKARKAPQFLHVFNINIILEIQFIFISLLYGSDNWCIGTGVQNILLFRL